MSVHTSPRSDMAPGLSYERKRLEDVGYMTCMTLTLLGNYAQTGHFGGPLAYTPFNVAAHLAGPELGGLRYDYRRPKHPYGDKFMLAAGHCAPTCYALWMILGQALYRKHQATGDPRYHVAPDVAMLPVDALGFRRGAGALRTLLADQGLSDHPLFAQAKGRGIRALSGHIESTDLTNDVSGKGGVLGHHGRPHGDAEGHRARGRVRHDRGTRPGAQDPGHRAAGRQAAPDLPVLQQRRHRRFLDRWRGVQPVHGLPLDRPVDFVRVERVVAAGWSRLRPDRGRAPDHGGVGPGGSPPDDRDRHDHQGVLARRGERQDPRGGRPGGGLPEPSVRDEDELGILRRPGAHLRGALRCRVPGDQPGTGDRPAGAAHPVQDEHRRRHVRARARWPR